MEPPRPEKKKTRKGRKGGAGPEEEEEADEGEAQLDGERRNGEKVRDRLKSAR